MTYTPEQLELLKNFRHFDFLPNEEGHCVLRSLYVFSSHQYDKQFDTVEEAIEHAKIVIAECGGTWEHPKIDLSEWVISTFGERGCTVEILCDPELYKKFMVANGTEWDPLK